jgi:hypothetical protein
VNDVDGGLAIESGSLLVRGVALADAASTEFVEVDRKFGTAGHITYAFDVRLDTLDSNGAAVEVAAVSFTTGPSSYSTYHVTAQLSGWLLGEDTHFADGGTAFVPIPLQGTLSAAWSRVEMDIALDTTPRTVTVRKDGVVAGTRVTPANFPTGPLHVYVGIVFAHGPSEPVLMHFDNVTLRLADAG